MLGSQAPNVAVIATWRVGIAECFGQALIDDVDRFVGLSAAPKSPRSVGQIGRSDWRLRARCSVLQGGDAVRPVRSRIMARCDADIHTFAVADMLAIAVDRNDDHGSRIQLLAVRPAGLGDAPQPFIGLEAGSHVRVKGAPELVGTTCRGHRHQATDIIP